MHGSTTCVQAPAAFMYQSSIIRTSRTSLLFATKELPSPSRVFTIMQQGLMIESSWNRGLPALRQRMSRARSPNSIVQKYAPNPMVIWGLVDVTILPRLLAHALLLLVELAPHVHSDNDLLPSKFGTKLKIHTRNRWIMFAYMSNRPSSTAIH